MAGKIGFVAKVFAPAVVSKVLRTFDKATVVVISCCWGGAICLMLFALYTLHLSVKAKAEMVEAAAKEPLLPIVVGGAPDKKALEPIVDRLQKRFPDVSFSLGPDRTMMVTAINGNQFRSWLNALSYVDTMVPEYRWKIKDLCVGAKCVGSTPMRAALTAEKTVFRAPEIKNP